MCIHGKHKPWAVCWPSPECSGRGLGNVPALQLDLWTFSCTPSVGMDHRHSSHQNPTEIAMRLVESYLARFLDTAKKVLRLTSSSIASLMMEELPKPDNRDCFCLTFFFLASGGGSGIHWYNRTHLPVLHYELSTIQHVPAIKRDNHTF